MDQSATTSPNDIAVIGMALRVPGADSVPAFWHNLQNGIESIREFTHEEMLTAGVDPDLLKHPSYVKAGSVLDGIDLFDARFFGYTPREAELIDPQQRLFLECTWEALEHAGYAAQTEQARIGIFAGAGMNGYLLNNIMTNPALVRTLGMYQIMLGNDKDYLATRASFKLNLRGPSINVNVGCSSSLVAIHLARQSLLSYESDICLAGGVSIDSAQRTGYLYQEGGIASPDGHCRAFDANANGTVSASGVGIVVLKRLQEALDDRDTIYAILKGTAVNNDGSLKVGFTAPGVDGQAEVIALAQAVAGVMPDDITYVETHGTGTNLGDPIEIAALTQAFHAYTDRTQYCALGSLKTNLGHLDTAAGVASFIKTVLALYHRQIPPSLHFAQPNPHIDFANSPFFVNTRLRPWENSAGPRLAGVSSFGIGGTNAHAILEEAPELLPTKPASAWQVLTLSAQTATALATASANLVTYLKGQGDVHFADVAYTLNVGRKAFSHRRSIVARNATEAIASLEDEAITAARNSIYDGKQPAVAFMFPGQGTQYVTMAAELYQHEPLFREYVDRCSELLKPHIQMDLRSLLYPAHASSADETRLEQTELAQPAIFVISYTLAQLWMSWGVQPTMMIGHSVGEYVAACLAGTMTLEDALKLVATRGRLVQTMPAGSMLAVPLPEAEVRTMLDRDTDLAAVNGPTLCVVSGSDTALARIEQTLRERGLSATHLHTSHAFHSAMMDPVLEPFMATVRTIHLQAPNIPFISGVTGTWITPEQATDPAYWVGHLRQTVRFADGASVLLHTADPVFLEVGPGRTLSTFVQQQPGANRRRVFNSLRHPQDQTPDEAFLLDKLGQVWSVGCTIDWTAVYRGEKHQRLPLPTYPFERQSYWIARSAQAMGESSVSLTDAQETLMLHERPASIGEIVAPRDDTERQIAAIWQELLGFEAIGIHDDFFELGGHSLLLTRLISRLCNEFQVNIPLEKLFEQRTVARMAILVAQAQAELVDSDILAALLDELEEAPDDLVDQTTHHT